MTNRWFAAAIILLGVAAIFALSQLQLFAPKSILILNATAQQRDAEKANIAIFLTIENTGAPDTLLSASVKGAAETQFMKTIARHSLAIPARSQSSLSSDGVHIVAMGVRGLEASGQLIPMELTFAKAGRLAAKARLDTSKMDAHAMMGHSMMYTVQDGEPTPSLSLSIAPALDGTGWQLRLDHQNFTFSEAMVGQAHVTGHGHGHVYLNGLKLGRVYGNTFPIGALPTGTHEVMVSLNTNNHRAYVVDGAAVMAKAIITSE